MPESFRAIEMLKEVAVFRDSDEKVTGQKGTTCTRFSDGQQEWVEKQWVSGDWVFSGDYEYGVENRVYEVVNALALPVPRLLGSNDEERIHKYRLDQLQFIFPEESVWKKLDSIYESFLQNIQYCAIPFDRILKNTILCGGTLFFFDFEWSIAGPYEFTLARTAVEFNEYDHPEIMSRVTSMNLYHLFLLRFYMYGQEPESLSAYLRTNLEDPRLLGDLRDHNHGGICGQTVGSKGRPPPPFP